MSGLPCEICPAGSHTIRTAADLENHPQATVHAKLREEQRQVSPELAKWADVCDTGASMVVQDFLEWAHKRGMCLATYDSNDRLTEIHVSHEELVYRFFEVDSKKLDAEREAVLKEVRALHRAG